MQTRGGGRCNSYDIHDILVREAYSQGIPKPDPNYADAVTTSIAAGAAPTPAKPFATIKDSTFYFDSVYKDQATNSTTGQLIFSITSINSLNPIQNIVAIKINSFYFPNISPNGLTDYFYYRRVYMRIGDMARQSTIQSHNSRSYHFEFDIENTNSTAVKLIPTNPIFYLQEPLTALSSLTVTFFTPINFQPIPIPADTLLVAPDPTGLATGDFTVINGFATDIAPIGVITAPGIPVFFAGYDSASPTLNATINASGGVFVTEIVSNTVFRIGIAILAAPLTSVIVGKNRIAFEMRFTVLDNNAANGAIPTHV